jgi:tetratricopeptide (TPR) repeat protein
MKQTPGPGGASSSGSGLPSKPNMQQEIVMQSLCLTLPTLLALIATRGTSLEEATKAFQAGDYSKVLELAAAPDASASDGPRLAYLAGEAELALGAPSEAEKAFRSVLAARPKAIPAQVGLGRALTALARFDEAEPVLKAALAADPRDVGALVARGLLLSSTGKSDDAKKDLEEAWKLDPKGAMTARGYVEVLLRADDVPGAAAIAESFMSSRPQHPLGPFLLAWTLERDDEDEQAIEQYKASLALDPNFIDSHKNLAILCHTLSNTYKIKERVLLAYEHYERYFALGGKDQELERMYKDLLGFKAQILGE